MFKAYRKSIRLKAWAVEQISVTVYPMIMKNFHKKASHAVNGSCEFFVYFLKAFNASLKVFLICFMQQGGSIQVVGAHVISYYVLVYLEVNSNPLTQQRGHTSLPFLPVSCYPLTP